MTEPLEIPGRNPTWESIDAAVAEVLTLQASVEAKEVENRTLRLRTIFLGEKIDKLYAQLVSRCMLQGCLYVQDTCEFCHQPRPADVTSGRSPLLSLMHEAASLAAVDAVFREGMRAREEEQNTCPYTDDDWREHWWTRGFAYVARQMNAMESARQAEAAQEEILLLRKVLGERNEEIARLTAGGR